MASTVQLLEKRLERVEKELFELKAALSSEKNIPWYRRIVGDYADTNKTLQQMMRMGRMIRRGKLKR